MASAFALLFLGFALLALSQDRYQECVFGSNGPIAPASRAQRATGLIAIALALPLCVWDQGGGFGSLLWVVLMGAAAMAVALLLTWRPRSLRLLGLWRIGKTPEATQAPVPNVQRLPTKNPHPP
ncbi:MAG: DUF3325 domain-containing protein [Pseudomonadota bacterium]|nr:DUF3325 domain-containing protein [Pseudomonadota bacterium]